jgi:uncharacterized membrane protein YvlD (DUF360 family)
MADLVVATPRTLRWSIRIPVVLAITAGSLLVANLLLPGFRLDGWGSSFAAAGVLGLVNALLWPLVVRLALPLTVLTLGLFPLLLNGAIILAIGEVLPGFSVSGLWTGIAVTAIVAAVSSTLMTLLSIDDEGVWTRRVLRRAAARARRDHASDVPGILFVQIDGLGHDVIVRAVRDGNLPTLAGWLRSGSHALSAWETDWSSQTGASQAGILHGSNHDMPAFRWLEKETGTVMVSNRPACAAEIERRRSDGRGLLHADGVSRGNIFTGDAVQSVLTMSVAARRKGRIGSGYYAYFAHPYNTIRTIVGSLAEIGREVREAAQQRRRDVRPRVHRGGVYPLLRTFTTVISRDVMTATLVGDLCDGRAVIYADYVGYDEVAHHSGVERHESLDTLRRLDRELGRLATAAAEAARPYRIVVLSDHGQSQGPTFLQRYGESLADLVTRTVGADATAPAAQTGDESWGYAAGALQELAAGDGLGARAVHRMTRGRTDGDDVLLGPERDAVKAAPGPVTVLASGNLGLISIADLPGRVTREQIDRRYPQLLPTLLAHPGVGFLLVDSEAHGPLVLGARGRHVLLTGDVLGEDPLAGFGPLAAVKVLRTHGFPHCADIMVNSIWDEQTDEVAAFEELVGSHGGMGGGQSRGFVLHPADLELPGGGVVGAESLHRVFRGWLAQLGQAAYAEDAAVRQPVSS